jgi:hypothetical protein
VQACGPSLRRLGSHGSTSAGVVGDHHPTIFAPKGHPTPILDYSFLTATVRDLSVRISYRRIMSGVRLRSTFAACRVIAAIALGIGGPVGSLLGDKQIQDGAPLTTQSVPPHSSLTFDAGYQYVGVFFPKRVTIQNPGNNPMTVNVRQASIERRVAGLVVGGGGSLLTLGAAAAIAGVWRPRRATSRGLAK